MISIRLYIYFLLPGCVVLQVSSVALISRDKTITSSSQYWPPARAIDGSTRSDADLCQCCAATNGNYNPWYELDLGQSYIIHRIVVQGRSESRYNQHFEGMRILLKRIDDGYDNAELSINDRLTYVDYVLPTTKSSRYVSLVLYGRNIEFTICELSVYGVLQMSPVALISRDKTITSSSQYWPPARAIDGSTRSDADLCQCCAATNGNYNPWYELDLGQSYIIHRIVVQGRSESRYNQHFEGMRILLKSIDDGYDNAELSINDSSTYVDYVLPTTRSSRYVSLVLYGKNTVFTICELLVYGECDDGRYGENCELACGNCKNGTVCNKQTGFCEAGCDPGYIYQPYCNQECSNGFYGDGCLSRCGNCKSGTVCNHVTGVCAEGCTARYMSELCTECKDGYHGANCLDECGQCSNGDACNKYDGSCKTCATGYGGRGCKMYLGSDEETKSGISGGVIGGVVVSVVAVGLVVVIVVVVIFMRRRRQSTEKTTDRREEFHKDSIATVTIGTI